VLIKVEATDSNPKDWKVCLRGSEAVYILEIDLDKAAAVMTINQGDDIAGVVARVGASVHDFKPGDRVAAFHRMFAESGSYAEYAIAPAGTTFHLPPHVSFEAGATLPLASMTAALALYQHLELPTPWNPVPKGREFPVLIYGGSSAVGAFALKFAKLSNLNPVITVAGSGVEFVKSLHAADYVVDYREGQVPATIKEILDGKQLKLMHAFDAICEHDSWKHILDVLAKTEPAVAKFNMVDPPEPMPEWPAGVEFSRTFVATAHGVAHSYAQRTPEEAAYDCDFAYIFYR